MIITFQYAVKFICGKSDGRVVAPGAYWTAVNVHNPGTNRIVFQKKFAIALPNEKAGPVSQTFRAVLGPDEALEIDREDILRHSPMPADFLKGFVLIESHLELDVVAVYTAAPVDGQVQTVELERVAPRRREVGLPDLIPVPDENGNFCRRDGAQLVVTVRNSGIGIRRTFGYSGRFRRTRLDGQTHARLGTGSVGRSAVYDPARVFRSRLRVPHHCRRKRGCNGVRRGQQYCRRRLLGLSSGRTEDSLNMQPRRTVGNTAGAHAAVRYAPGGQADDTVRAQYAAVPILALSLGGFDRLFGSSRTQAPRAASNVAEISRYAQHRVRHDGGNAGGARPHADHGYGGSAWLLRTRRWRRRNVPLGPDVHPT